MDWHSYKLPKTTHISKITPINTPYNNNLFSLGFNHYILYNENFVNTDTNASHIMPQIEKKYYEPVLYLDPSITDVEDEIKKYYKLKNITVYTPKYNPFFALNTTDNSIELVKTLQEKSTNYLYTVINLHSAFVSKFIYILTSLYNEVYIHKSYINFHSNITHIICIDMKKQLTIDNKQNSNITDFDFTLPKNFKDNLLSINLKITNKKYEHLNEIFNYIDNNNFFGTDYNNYIKRQKEYTQEYKKYLK